MGVESAEIGGGRGVFVECVECVEMENCGFIEIKRTERREPPASNFNFLALAFRVC